jgi:hypothetical protein
VPPKLDIQQVKQILAASDLIAFWQVLIEDETAQRALYKIRCRVIRVAYELEIRFIQTEDEIIYSYQLFTDRPIIRWDNAPHFPALHGYPHHVHSESSEVDESTLIGDPILDLPYVLSWVRDLVTKPSL